MTDSRRAEAPAVPAGEQPKRGRKKLVVIVAAVVVLLVGAVGYLKFVKKPAPLGKPVPGKVLSIPTQTLNLADGRLLQVGVAVQLTTIADPAAVNADRPRIANIILTQLAPYTYRQLLTTKGRNQAQRHVSKAITVLLNKPDTTDQGSGQAAKTGPTQALGAFFTTFLMQ